MNRTFAALPVVVTACILAVFAAPAQAGHVNTTCNFSANKYKYSGIEHDEPGAPTWTLSGGLVFSLRYWSFTAGGDHTLALYGVGNTQQTAWMQVGLSAGYDPWGNKLSQNYPLGTWGDLVHPNDGHDTGHPTTYTPVSWGIVRYAETKNAALNQYAFQSISDNFPLSAGQTVRFRYDGNSQFSIIDQDSHTLGIANHVTIPQVVGQPGYRFQLMLENYSNDGWCDDNITQSSNFENPTNSYWTGYLGCSANGWNGDNINDPNCRGGASSQTAPFDFWRNTAAGNYQTQMYEQEAETTGPPFAVNQDQSDLPPSSVNPTDGVVSGQPQRVRVPEPAVPLPRPAGSVDGPSAHPPRLGR